MRYKKLLISLEHNRFDNLREISLHQLSRTVNDQNFFETDRAFKEVFPVSAVQVGLEILIADNIPWGEPTGITRDNVNDSGQLLTDGLYAINLFNALLIPKANLLCYDNGLIIKEYLGPAYHKDAMRWLRKRWSFKGGFLEITKHIDIAPVEHEHGIDFSTDPGDKNVFHWIARVLPKVKFLEILPNSIPLVFGYEPTEFQLDSLRVFGVKNPILIINRELPCRFNQYLLVEGSWASSNIHMMRFLRDKLIGADSNSENLGIGNNNPKKIFIFRKESWTRKLINRAQIMDYLVGKGFVGHSLEGMHITETVELFKHAEEIVFEHGAAGIFLLFISSATKVIEIIPSKVHVRSNVSTNFFFWLTRILGRTFGHIICENIKNDPWAEFQLDLSELKAMMRRLNYS